MKKSEQVLQSTDRTEARSPFRTPGRAKARSASTINPILDLQRAAGNQAVFRLLESGAIQTKLGVSRPGDAGEIEADRVADSVARSPSVSTLQRKSSCAGGAPCLNSEEEKLRIRPKAEATSPASDGSVSENFLQDLGPGQPLDPQTLSFFESYFDHSFRDVRVHTDARASESARRLGALAYTRKCDIVFGDGHFHVDSPEGKWLLAHELVHVVQQRSTSASGSPADEFHGAHQAAEKEAETVSGAIGLGLKAERITQSASGLQKADGKGPAPTRIPSAGPRITVIGHGASSAAVEVARRSATEILGNLQPANAARLKGVTIELHIIPHDKKLTDLPEYSSLKGKRTSDGRLYDDLRGAGGMRVGSTIRYAIAEEQLISGGISLAQVLGGIIGGLVIGGAGIALGAAIGSLFGPLGTIIGGVIGGLAGLVAGGMAGAALGKQAGQQQTGYARGFVGGHESGHIVEQYALTSAQTRELQRLFADRQKAGGPWLNPAWYTSSNTGEYFAQSVAAYFGHPYSSSEDDKKAYTRAWLQKNDPGMYRLLSAVFR